MRISDWSSDVCSSDLSVLSGKGILDGAECCKCGCALFGTNFELTCPDQRGVFLRAIFLAFLVGDRPVPAFAYIAQAGAYASIKNWRSRLGRQALRSTERSGWGKEWDRMVCHWCVS